MLGVAALTHTGRRRRNNEDAVLAVRLPRDEILLAVADGVGGERAGEIASRHAVRLLEQQMKARPVGSPGDRLRSSVRHLNGILWQRSQNEDHLRGMATTIVAAFVDQGQAWIANVGDSRAYLVAAAGARQITRDHSLVADAVREGELTEDEARVSNARHVITRSVGSSGDLEVDVFGPLAIPPDARLLLCSDGLYDVVEDGEIAAAVAGVSPESAARALIDLANERGGPDNVSVVIYHQPPDASASSRTHDASLAPLDRYTIAGITASAIPILQR